MKPIDLSGFDAEFPPYVTRDPNEETIDSRLEGIAADLKYLSQMMIADDSDEIARAAMTAKSAIEDLLYETRGTVGEFAWTWWPRNG